MTTEQHPQAPTRFTASVAVCVGRGPSMSGERMWFALLAQANANHATASTLLHLVQQRGVEAPVCLLEPDHVES